MASDSRTDSRKTWDPLFFIGQAGFMGSCKTYLISHRPRSNPILNLHPLLTVARRFDRPSDNLETAIEATRLVQLFFRFVNTS